MTLYCSVAEIEEWATLGGSPTMVAGGVNGRGGTSFTGTTEDAEYGETPAFSASDFWTHFVFATDIISAGARHMVKWYSGGTQRLALYASSGDPIIIELRQWGGSSWTTLASTTIGIQATSTTAIWDVYIKLGNPGSFRLYTNNVPRAALAGIDLSFVSAIDKIRFQCYGGTSNQDSNFSEVIVADWNTLGSKLVTKTPDANGTYTEWTGAGYTLIDEVVAGTDFMTSPTADQRFSFSSADFPVLASGESIENVRLAYRANRDAAGPQNINGFARVSSTDYHASDQTLNVAPTLSRYVDWATNPAGGAWTVSALNAAEFGLRSRT